LKPAKRNVALPLLKVSGLVQARRRRHRRIK
jgi:hypothetical protein